MFLLLKIVFNIWAHKKRLGRKGKGKGNCQLERVWNRVSLNYFNWNRKIHSKYEQCQWHRNKPKKNVLLFVCLEFFVWLCFFMLSVCLFGFVWMWFFFYFVAVWFSCGCCCLFWPDILFFWWIHLTFCNCHCCLCCYCHSAPITKPRFLEHGHTFKLITWEPNADTSLFA